MHIPFVPTRDIAPNKTNFEIRFLFPTASHAQLKYLLAVADDESLGMCMYLLGGVSKNTKYNQEEKQLTKAPTVLVLLLLLLA